MALISSTHSSSHSYPARNGRVPFRSDLLPPSLSRFHHRRVAGGGRCSTHRDYAWRHEAGKRWRRWLWGVAPHISASHARPRHRSSFLRRDQASGERPPGLGTEAVLPAMGADAASEPSRANGLGDAAPPSGAKPSGDDVEPRRSIFSFCSQVILGMSFAMAEGEPGISPGTSRQLI
ncbi:unnamed protein product [Miscanthus lutarioriparius]|uniref:Uncharacterized protein n=1 Tax=Miscanthus lutarioriparius TaxID=422564 RepID=A0A811S777_9POAL|nr:unnamed protein product [Miscanthus lutarioriparius]